MESSSIKPSTCVSVRNIDETGARAREDRERGARVMVRLMGLLHRGVGKFYSGERGSETGCRKETSHFNLCRAAANLILLSNSCLSSLKPNLFYLVILRKAILIIYRSLEVIYLKNGMTEYLTAPLHSSYFG